MPDVPCLPLCSSTGCYPHPPPGPQGLENLAFLDDSGSMSSGGWLGQGHDALRAVLPLLGSAGPMRIVKFGSHKTLVAPREAASAAAGAADALLPTVLTVGVPHTRRVWEGGPTPSSTSHGATGLTCRRGTPRAAARTCGT